MLKRLKCHFAFNLYELRLSAIIQRNGQHKPERVLIFYKVFPLTITPKAKSIISSRKVALLWKSALRWSLCQQDIYWESKPERRTVLLAGKGQLRSFPSVCPETRTTKSSFSKAR